MTTAATEATYRGYRISLSEGGLFLIYAPGVAESVDNTFTQEGARHSIDRLILKEGSDLGPAEDFARNIQNEEAQHMSDNGQVHTLPRDELIPWPGLNPRRHFSDEEIDELRTSLKEDGMVQPIGVKMNAEAPHYVFAGERRLRASEEILSEIPVLVRDISEETALRLALTENIQRSNLSSIEEAWGLQRYLDESKKTQKAVADELGKTQGWVSNRIRLLELPKPIVTMIHEGTIAPALARDTLLRFLKLNKAVQPKLWKAIAKEVKREAKEASPVLLTRLRAAIVAALRSAGATEIREGHQYGRNSNASFNISRSRFDTFKKKHADRCIQAASSSWQGNEAMYTFALAEWTKLTAEEAEKARSTRSTGGVSKKKLGKPNLGPTKAPVELQKLKDDFGYENVILFSEIVDPSKIEPSSVARAKVPSYLSSNGKERIELAYVGPNVRAMKGARTRCATPIRAEVAKEVQTRRMDKAADLSIRDVLAGLLELVAGTDHSTTLRGMIEAEGHEVEEWTRYTSGNQVVPLKIPSKSLRRIAAGLAQLAVSDKRYWDLEEEVTKAVQKRVTKDTAKARKAWIDAHAPEASR